MCILSFFLVLRRPSRSPLFPYTTLFRSEMDLSRRASHPNLAKTLDVGNVGDVHFMVLEYIPGESLYQDRKSTRLNSSHSQISYAVFCLKKKTQTEVCATSDAGKCRIVAF